jgi:hypothetical protein
MCASKAPGAGILPPDFSRMALEAQTPIRLCKPKPSAAMPFGVGAGGLRFQGWSGWAHSLPPGVGCQAVERVST